MTTSPASFASDELHARVRANLTRVRARIAASAPDPTRVAVLAVTKTFGVAEITVALELGLTDVGENYVEELCDKHTAVPEATLRRFRLEFVHVVLAEVVQPVGEGGVNGLDAEGLGHRHEADRRGVAAGTRDPLAQRREVGGDARREVRTSGGNWGGRHRHRRRRSRHWWCW